MSGKVKVFVIGDLHFRKNFLKEGREFSDKCIQSVKKHKPHFTVVLGDTLDTNDTAKQQPYHLAYHFIEALSNISPVFLLIGNHDLSSEKKFLSDEHFFLPYRKWENVTVVDAPIQREIGEFTFTFCPYVPPGRFEEALNHLIEEGQNWVFSDAIFSHQDFKGCSYGTVPSFEGDEWSDDYPDIFNGHLHEPQIVGNIHCPGSAYQHTWAERCNKRVWLVTFGEDDPKTEKPFTIQKINLKIQGKKRISMDISDISTFDESLLDKHQIQIKARGTMEEWNVFKDSKQYKKLQNLGVRLTPDVVTEEIYHDIGDGQDISYMKVLREVVKLKSDNVKEAYTKVCRLPLGDDQSDIEVIVEQSECSDEQSGSENEQSGCSDDEQNEVEQSDESTLATENSYQNSELEDDTDSSYYSEE